MMDHKQEHKNNESDSPCIATQNYSTKHTLYYIEKNIPLIKDHVKMYNELRLHVDNVLARKTKWELDVLEPHLLSLVPSKLKNGKNGKNASKVPQHATDEMYSYLRTYATEATLIRAITGGDYRIEVAKKSILETVQWRVISKVDMITPDMFEKCIKTKVIYSLNKRDKRGHLICYFKVLEVPPEDPWELVRAAIWTIEKGVKMAQQKGLYQMIWLVDIEHLKYATVPPLNILKEIAHILQHYYPERLYRAYVLFSPWVFRMVWKMISGLLTENTKGKIIVPGWYESAQYETFQDNIGKHNLDKRFGGTLDMQYTFEWEKSEFHKTKNYTK